MLLHSHTSSVEISDGFESSSFTIVDSKNSFALLEGKQYENRIDATIRALLENALDAHTEANSSEKVTIRLESRQFSVADTGLGISPDVFRNNFTTFFASNRTHSNAYHGFFGVGAKAPLSVAPEFGVITVHDGLEYKWVCKRGDPAPTAELLSTALAPEGKKGTTVSIDLNKVDSGYSHAHYWDEKIADLQQAIPDALTVVNVGRRHETHAPILIIGGMPYPLPKNELLQLPGQVYDTDYVRIPAIQPAVKPAAKKMPTGKSFGKRVSAPSDTPKVIVEHRYPKLRIHFNIGELDLHFSKERVAFTAANIEKIRERTLQTWLDWQLGLAMETATLPLGQAIDWRMPKKAADALKTKGADLALLAWASRPLNMEFDFKAIKDSSSPLPIVWAHSYSKPQELPTMRFQADTYGELEHANAWAREWGLSIHWVRAESSKTAAFLSAGELERDSVFHLSQSVGDTIADKSPFIRSSKKLKDDIPDHPLVVVVEKDWAALDTQTRKTIGAWLGLNSTAPLLATSKSIEEVKTDFPHALSLHEYCKQHLLASIEGFKDDALGMKKCLFLCNQQNLTAWAKELWKDYSIKVQMSSVNPKDCNEAMHAWLNVTMENVQYIDLDDWQKKQSAKVPLLELISPRMSEEQTQHLNELLAHP